MSGARVARGIAIALLVAVLIASGVYLLVYLYRWEWNRAQISGIFFLSALVVLSLLWMMARLRRIEHRIDRQGSRAAAGHPPSWDDRASAPRSAGEEESDARPEGLAGNDAGPGTRRLVRSANDEHARRHFEWLRRPPDRLGVFVPILIGAGAIVALLTFAIERVAGLMAGPTVDRRIAEMLAPELPLGPDRPLDEVAREVRGPRRSHPATVGFGVLLGAAVLVGAILVLRDTTQNRAEPGLAEGETTIELAISQKGFPQPAEEVAEALWIACRERLEETATVEVQEDEVSTTRATIWVDQGMGPLRRRRFFGCLEDATLDRASATITSFRVDRPD